MPSLDDLKKRIKSVKSTQKITKAMKMVAAAKLRKAQEKAEKGRPYSQKMHNIIHFFRIWSSTFCVFLCSS